MKVSKSLEWARDGSVLPKNTQSTIMTAKINRLMKTTTALRANHLAAFLGRALFSPS